MNYLDEWKQSGVDPELVRLNVVALDGTEAYDYLCYSDKLPRRNDGRLASGMLKRYAHVESGGWWCSGTNLLTGTDDLWGCFKPELPRVAGDRDKPIKYEHPPKVETGVFALRVPVAIWRRIAERAELKFDENWIDRSRHDFGFWAWLRETPSVPVCITEGAKKAGALLSAGYAAIGLPGIDNGIRTPRDENGRRTGTSHTIAQISALTQNARPVYIAFDRDTKPNTVRAVNSAIRRLGYLISQSGSPVRVVTWSPEDGKGADDLIVARGTEAFDRAFTDALSLDTWKAQLLGQLSYRVDIDLEARYLPAAIAIPDDARLVAIQSPKGTGKTEAIGQWVQQAIARGQRVLVVGHRVQLVEALCRRFGLPYVTEIEDLRQVGNGYGLCIDSLHGTSQAKFRVEDWRDAIVIFDEVEQVLWHALNSETCRGRRVEVLETLKRLMHVTLGAAGRIYAADADLSDTSLDYLLALSGVDREPFAIRNRWKPTTPWQISHYTDSTPKRIFRDLEAHIAAGGRPFVCLDRKSTRLNSSHQIISYAVFCLKKKKTPPTLRHPY